MIGDTIFAVASPPGAAARGIVRISGPGARHAAAVVCRTPLGAARAALESSVVVLGFDVPALVLSMPAPRSYTGEDVVELHLPGSPLLLELVCAELRRYARDATPGEFTRRAFENGRIDLAEAEAVLALIWADSDERRRHALHVLQGGLGESIDRCRALLQDALALLEAGLDFEDGETGAVDKQSWLDGLSEARLALTRLRAGIPPAHGGGDLVLLGWANAGKSSLCNALAGRDEVLVAAEPGTTRDVLEVEIADGVWLCDTPGDVRAPAGWDRAAIELRDRYVEGAAGAVWVVDPTAEHAPRPSASTLPVAAVVLTKADLWQGRIEPPGVGDLPAAPRFLCSSVTGAGIVELRQFLSARGGRGPRGTGTRVADGIAAAAEALGAAIAAGTAGLPEELVAVDVGDALRALDDLHGRSTPEDLLDRIFGRFCLGK